MDDAMKDGRLSGRRRSGLSWSGHGVRRVRDVLETLLFWLMIAFGPALYAAVVLYLYFR